MPLLEMRQFLPAWTTCKSHTRVTIELNTALPFEGWVAPWMRATFASQFTSKLTLACSERSVHCTPTSFSYGRSKPRIFFIDLLITLTITIFWSVNLCRLAYFPLSTYGKFIAKHHNRFVTYNNTLTDLSTRLRSHWFRFAAWNLNPSAFDDSD